MQKSMDYKKIGNKIRDLRIASGVTQTKLANAIGCSVQHLSAVEHGRNPISFELFIRVIRFFDVSADAFLSERTRQKENADLIATVSLLRKSTEKEKRLFLELLKICKQLMEQA